MEMQVLGSLVHILTPLLIVPTTVREEVELGHLQALFMRILAP